MFSTISHTRINHPCGTLNTTKKNGLTTAQYFTKMREISSELATAGKPIEEDEMIDYALNGLDSSYNDLVSSVNGNPLTMFDELYSLINAHDLHCDMLAEDEQEPPFISSANAADHRGHDDHPRGNRGRSPDRQGNCNYRGCSPDHGDHGDRGDHGDLRGYHYGRRDGGQNRRYDDDGGQRRHYDDGGQRRRYDDGGQRRYDDGGQSGRRYYDDGGRHHDDAGSRCDDDNHRENGGQGRRRIVGCAPTPYIDISCQICKIHGHSASDCWWRNENHSDNDDVKKNDKEKGALMSYGVDTNWYTTLVQHTISPGNLANSPSPKSTREETKSTLQMAMV
jgi:hypothetical protein